MLSDTQRPRKPKRGLTARWLDFCEDVDHYLNKGHRHTTHAQGIFLLCSALFRWSRRKLGLDWLRTWWLKRASDRAIRKARNIEAKGLVKLTEKLEAAATTAAYTVSGTCSAIYKYVVPEKLIKSTEKTVTNASSDAFRSIQELAASISQRIFPKWLRQRFRFVGRASKSLYTFFTAWSKSRDMMKLAWSLPAALLAIPLLSAIVLSMIHTPHDKIQHYQRSLTTAIDERDEPSEQLCVEKLAQLGYQKLDQAEYDSAYRLGEDEKWEEAATRMRTIASTDAPGFAAAHIWLAHNLMYENIEHEDRWKAIKTHANFAKAKASGRNRKRLSDAADLYLAQCEFREGNTTTGMSELERLARKNDYLWFELLERYLVLGRQSEARSAAKEVDSLCKQMLKKTEKQLANKATDDEASETKKESAKTSNEEEPPVLTAMQYSTWAKATMLLGADPERTIGLLRDGLAIDADNEILKYQLGPLLQNKIRDVPYDAPEFPTMLVELFKIDPTDYVGAAKLDEALENNDELLSQLLHDLESQNALSHNICLHLGDLVWQSGESPAQATAYYEWAARLNPESGKAWNNVAWMRGCNEETLDLNIALTAANRAIDLEPDPNCYETRGQIFVRLKRWEEAVKDLRIALNGSLPDSKPAHRSMAIALAALGKDSTAEAHRRLANGS